MSEDVNVDTVTSYMEDQLTKFVGRDLLECDDDDRRRRRMLLESSKEVLQRMILEGMEIVGVSAAPVEAVSKDDCSYFVDTKVVEGTMCYVINGGMTLYLGEYQSDEPTRRRRRLAETDEVELEAASREALTSIEDAMNDSDPSPFLVGSGSEYAVSGLKGVRFVSGTTHEGETVTAENEKVIGGANTGTVETRSSKMTPVEGSMIGLGLLILIALVLGVVKRKQTLLNDSYNEFKDDDDDDLDTTFDDLSSSEPPTPSNKRAYVVGEEGSIYTSATHDTRKLFLHSKNEVGNGNDNDQQVDVHHCTSAMCPICNGKQTVFISAMEQDEGDGSVVTEGYEFEYDSSRKKRSFEYEPKEEVASPSFDNPAEIERPYVVDDTVVF